MKYKKLAELRVDPIIMQLYVSVTIFLLSFIILLWTPWSFNMWGFLAAAIWLPGNLSALFAIKCIGLSVAQGIWSGLIIIISFCWGSIVFRDPLKNVWLSVLGLLMLLAGIIGVATCKTQVNEASTESTPDSATYVGEIDHNTTKDAQNNDSISHETLEELPKPMNDNVAQEHIVNNIPDIENPEERTIHLETQNPKVENVETHQNEVVNNQEISKSIEEAKHEDNTQEQLNMTISKDEEHQTTFEKVKAFFMKSKNIFLGLFFCSLTGIFGGSTMVPLRFNPDQSPTSLISFGLGAVSCNIAIMIPYFLIKRELPKFHFKYTVLPGFANGIMWSIGMILATYITMSDLGLTIGYPLCQCAMIVSSLWGILVFKEIKGWKTLLQFGISILVLVPGCILLGIFGKA